MVENAKRRWEGGCRDAEPYAALTAAATGMGIMGFAAAASSAPTTGATALGGSCLTWSVIALGKTGTVSTAGGACSGAAGTGNVPVAAGPAVETGTTGGRAGTAARGMSAEEAAAEGLIGDASLLSAPTATTTGNAAWPGSATPAPSSAGGARPGT